MNNVFKVIYCIISLLILQEAHAMVRAANVKRAAAEKRFKEANNKVGGKLFVFCWSSVFHL